MKIKKKHIIGMIVLVIFLISGLYLCFLMNNYKIQDKLTISRAPNNISIPFRYSSDGHMLIDVKIDNSNKTYPFILDTGASNYLFQSFPKEKIGKSIGRGIGMDPNGKIFFPKIFNIPFLDVSGIELKNIAFNKSPSEFPCTENIYGIIGKNIMRHFAWQLDFQDNKIYIAKESTLLPKQEEEGIQLKLKENRFSHHLYIPIYLSDNTKARLIVDTGMSGILKLSTKEIASLPFAKKINILGEGSRGLGGKSNSKQYLVNLENLHLGKKKTFLIPTITTKISEKSSFRALGLGFLKKFVVTIDWTTSSITLYQKTKNLELTEKDFGVSFGFEEEIYIKSVIEGSKAHALGITPNMKGFSINNNPIKTVAQFCEFKSVKKQLDSLKLTFKDTNKEYILSRELYNY
ncbi:hypothetical protein [uncultured Aquimarina sp.]|uniref:hypothetical protein n=1 Tax=uncultured Aquimarina sp. TaxID=575652 RepID=UPI002625277B|nr:hypothetical protein [uncultured Aquimarina sp.]